jgi:hypothetical protein
MPDSTNNYKLYYDKNLIDDIKYWEPFILVFSKILNFDPLINWNFVIFNVDIRLSLHYGE